MEDSLFIKEGESLFRIPYEELQYVEAVKRYVRFVTAERNYLTEVSLYKVESKLPKRLFCRIHRSYIISLKHTRKVESKVITIGNKNLPIGRNYRAMLNQRVSAIVNAEWSAPVKKMNDLFYWSPLK